MIDKCELALLGNNEYVSGLYDEIEEYCKEQDTYVERYLDHVNPSSVQKGFKYVGSAKNPYELQRGFDYSKKKSIVDNSW